MKTLCGGRPWEPSKVWMGEWYEVWDGPRFLGMFLRFEDLRAWVVARPGRWWRAARRCLNEAPVWRDVTVGSDGRSLVIWHPVRKGGSR